MSYQFANDKDLNTLYAALPQTLKDGGYVGGDKPNPDDINYIGRLAQEAYAEGVDSGLKVVTEGAEGSETTGYRLNGVSTTGKGQIGEGAVDLSGQVSSGTGFGATGTNSHTEGLDTSATTSFAHAEGQGVKVEQRAAHGEGLNNTIPSTAPVGAHVEGSLATEDNWEDKMSVIGIGIPGSQEGRRDGRILYTDGTMELPWASIRGSIYRGANAVPTIQTVQYFKSPSAVWSTASYVMSGNEIRSLLTFIVPCFSGARLLIKKFGFFNFGGRALKYIIDSFPGSMGAPDPILANGDIASVRDVDTILPAILTTDATITVSVTYDGAPAEMDRILTQGSSVWLDYTFVEAE